MAPTYVACTMLMIFITNSFIDRCTSLLLGNEDSVTLGDNMIGYILRTHTHTNAYSMLTILTLECDLDNTYVHTYKYVDTCT